MAHHEATQLYCWGLTTHCPHTHKDIAFSKKKALLVGAMGSDSVVSWRRLSYQSVCFAFPALICCHVRLTRWYTSAGYTFTKRLFDNYKTTIWQLYDNLFDNLFDNCTFLSFSHSRHKFHEISKNVSPFGYCMRWKLQKNKDFEVVK